MGKNVGSNQLMMIESLFRKVFQCRNVSECNKLYEEVDNHKDLLGYPSISICLRYLICQHTAGLTISESDIYKHFKENHTCYIPNSNIVKVKMNNKHRPDFFVSVCGVLSPVEIKLWSFDNLAKEQLQRYMFIYKTQHGFAIARELTTDLPENITFIKFNPEDIPLS